MEFANAASHTPECMVSLFNI